MAPAMLRAGAGTAAPWDRRPGRCADLVGACHHDGQGHMALA